MDAGRFDSLTRSLTAGLPRRKALTIVLIGGARALGEPGPAAAGCKKVGKKCGRNNDCCDNARCGGKRCKCKSGFTECGGKCYDLDKDEKHCGDCGAACAAGDSCIDGVCNEGGCTAELDSCAPDALCISCPNRPGSVCYLDNAGQPRCSVVLLCFDCEDDNDCASFGPGARCITSCPGQCSGTACAAD